MQTRIRREPLLSADDEVRLAGLIAAGGPDGIQARDQMVTANAGLVVTLARRYPLPLGVDFDDVVQEGFIGLLYAVDRFDPGFGTRFSTYAVPWIRKKILAYLDANAGVVRVPASVMTLVRSRRGDLSGRDDWELVRAQQLFHPVR